MVTSTLNSAAIAALVTRVCKVYTRTYSNMNKAELVQELTELKLADLKLVSNGVTVADADFVSNCNKLNFDLNAAEVKAVMACALVWRRKYILNKLNEILAVAA